MNTQQETRTSSGTAIDNLTYGLRSARSSNQFTAAVRARTVEAVGAVGAPRALEAADVCLVPMLKRHSTAFANWTHLKSHRLTPPAAGS